MSDEVATKTDKAAESSSLSLVTVVGAAASGIGLLGFVTFAGGATLWVRFKEMGLPPARAVSLIPKSELIATGAERLTPALAVAGIIVLVLIWYDRHLTAARPTPQPAPVEPQAQPSGLAGCLVASFASSSPKREREHKRKLARAAKDAAKQAKAESEHKRKLALFAGCVVVSIGVVVSIALLVLTVDFLAFLILLVATALASVVIAFSAVNLKSRSTFFLVAFLAAGLFWMVGSYAETSQSLSVIPMAYSRAQAGTASRVEVGYFVAETSDRIFFASLPKGEQNELREFPRGETDDLEVGQPVPVEEAESAAARFAYNLCQRLLSLIPLKKPTKQAPAPEPPCPATYLEALKRTAGLH